VQGLRRISQEPRDATPLRVVHDQGEVLHFLLRKLTHSPLAFFCSQMTVVAMDISSSSDSVCALAPALRSFMFKSRGVACPSVPENIFHTAWGRPDAGRAFKGCRVRFGRERSDYLNSNAPAAGNCRSGWPLKDPPGPLP
jgi:hypothetical protein